MTNKTSHNWGGARPHPLGREGGRPPMQFGRKNLVLDCTEAEYQQIIKALSTRQRVKVLLEAIKDD